MARVKLLVHKPGTAEAGRVLGRKGIPKLALMVVKVPGAVILASHVDNNVASLQHSRVTRAHNIWFVRPLAPTLTCLHRGTAGAA